MFVAINKKYYFLPFITLLLLPVSLSFKGTNFEHWSDIWTQDPILSINFKFVNQWNKRDNGVICTGKEIKSGLKLVGMETGVAKHTCKLLLRKKNLKIVISVLYFCRLEPSSGQHQ